MLISIESAAVQLPTGDRRGGTHGWRGATERGSLGIRYAPLRRPDVKDVHERCRLQIGKWYALTTTFMLK